MNKLLSHFLTFLLVFCSWLAVNAQGVPELIYYKFDTPGTTTQNLASLPVSANGTLNGATIGGTGQFGSALLGNGGATSSNSVNANWPLNLSGPWTMSMWFSGVTSSLSSNYLFGGSGGTTFRSLTGSGNVAGAGNLMIRSTGMTDLTFNNVFDATGTPVVITLVYDPTVPAMKGYVNGVLNTTVAQPATLTFTGTDFTVGSQASSTGLPTGGKIDEFRLYNRALSAAEIATTWNVMLPYAVSPNDAGITAITAPTSPGAPGNQNIQVILKNYGTAPLTSAQIGWKVNSTSGTPYAWSGNLATNTASSPITIGSFNFPNGTYTIKAWTNNPNGATDGNHYNDTVSTSVIICTTMSGTYTINKNAPVSASNFQSFATALQGLNSCGISGPVTFNVVAGTGPYNESITLNNVSGTSATNTITFNGNGNTVISPVASGDGVIKLDGAKYIRFNNLRADIDAASTAGTVVSLINAAQYNIFDGCTFNHSTSTTSTSQVVYVYSGSSNNTFQNNTITGAYYGIYNYGASATLNTNNSFRNNILKDQYYYGIYNYYSPNSLIEGNDISRPTRTNATTMYAIYNSTSGTGLVVSKNRIHNTHDVATSTTGTVYGIYTSAAGTVGSENIIKNNAIYNINNDGGILYAFYNSGGNNTYYYHNTVSSDDATVSHSTLRGIYFLSASTNVKFINNNISLSGPATTKHAIYLSSATIALTSNNNNLYVGTSGNVGYYSGDKATLALWQAANATTPYDMNSVSADPQYVNLATGIVKPTNSTLNNIGQPLPAVTDDIIGVVRSTTAPDPGVYEFTPAANDAGITTIVSPTSPVTPNVSQPVTVTLKNYGINNLTAATITWTVNGTTQTVYNWTGNLANNQTANVNIGNYTFPAGTFALNICTSLPNGSTDANPGNDCQSVNIISCASLAGTYTINKNAPNSATNFQSFTSAVNTLNSCGVSAPVIFNVVTGSGPYNEVVSINNISGTSATNTITFNGNANTLASPSASADATVTLDGAKYVRINNLKIEANPATTAGTVVSLVNAAQYNTFNGCNITHSITTTSTSQAVYIYTGSSNNTFQNNIITGAYYGIYNYGASALPNNNNTFIGNTVKDFYYYGIYSYYTTGSVYEGNDVSRPTRTNATTMYGMYMSTSNTNLTISKNRIHNTHDAASTTTGTVYGIYTSSPGTLGTENIVKNNAIYNVNNAGGALYALYNSGGNNTYYYHNTVAANDPAVNYTTLRGMYFLSASTNVKFINNNVSLSSPATTKHAIYLSSATIALTSNNNNLYVGTSGNVGYYSGDKATLALWQAANATTPYDMNSVSADPIFSNPATGDLHPTSVALNNLGQPLPAVTDDITGAVRNTTTPDMGAFEFSLSPNDVGITAISGPVSGCGLTGSETITVTIKNFGTATQTSIPVGYKLNGVAVPTETWTGTLAPNATVNYAFNAKANLAAAGAYTLVANTNLTGDASAANNTDTLKVTNSLMSGLPNLNFETTNTGINAMRLELKTKSAISEGAGASFGPGSTKGMIMDGVDNTNWQIPAGVIDPWAVNADNFAGAYLCFSPAGGSANDSLYLTFDLKQLFKAANANTNFRVTVNGTQVGPTYRPPFTGSPIAWQKVKVNLYAYKNLSSIQIGFESSVKEAYAGGAGTANLIDNVHIVRRIVSGVKDDILSSGVQVYPNPSTGIFNVSLPSTGKNFSLEVTDLTGKVIKQQTASSKDKTAQLKLNTFAQGVYLLKVTSDQAATVRRIVIQ